MKRYFITIIFGFVVWLFATIFFILFGEAVLYAPGSSKYFISLFLLLLATGKLVFVVTKIYLIFDRTDHAALKFGIVGTVIGLSLDMLSLSNHHYIFPKLDPTQVIAFSAWMSFAYALYIVIPAIINFKNKEKLFNYKFVNKVNG